MYYTGTTAGSYNYWDPYYNTSTGTSTTGTTTGGWVSYTGVNSWYPFEASYIKSKPKEREFEAGDINLLIEK